MALSTREFNMVQEVINFIRNKYYVLFLIKSDKFMHL